MELLRLYMSDASPERIDALRNVIQKELDYPAAQQLNKKINILTTHHSVRCYSIPHKYKSKKDGPLVFRAISQGIAQYTIDHLERRLLRQLIRQMYKQYDGQEAATIEEYCASIIDSDEFENEGNSRKIRTHKLAQAFANYLAHHQELNIEGFIYFRMPTYRAELQEVVDYAVEEYVMDKQYQEFITLLQYFVLLQDRKVPEVHIIHKEGSNFIILDEHFKPIEKKKTEDFVMELLDKDLNYEDMVISALISISPEKICIHTRTKELQIIRTIQQIFENRTDICERCDVCHPVHEQFSLDH